MGILDRLKRLVTEPTPPVAEIKEASKELVLFDESFTSISALYPNELDVLNNSAVWAAVRYIATTLSTLPLHVFTKDGKIREINTEHIVAKVLQNPNPFMTKSVFIEVMSINLELFGVAYAEITWTENTLNKYPKMLLPISPRDIQVMALDGNLNYLYTPTGQYIPRENLLVVMGSSLNGFLPLNPIKYMKTSVDLAKAGENLQKKFFEKGTMMGGIIKVPRDFDNEQKMRIKTSFDNAFTGSHNAYGTVILNEGITYEPIKFNAEDNQLIQNRNFTVQEVARRFGVSPYALGDLSHATFSNVEQQAINDVRTTFRPRIVKFEEAFNQKLFNPKDKQSHYIKFSMEGMLRGDTNTRYQSYNIALQNGFLTRNEIRALEDLNPVENADTLFVPLNMVSLDKALAYDPNANSFSYGYYPAGEAIEVKETLEEQVLTEAYYISERSKITTSKKVEIERLVRKIVKEQIDLLFKELEELPTTGKETFKKNYGTSARDIVKHYEEEFNKIFDDVAQRLNPIIAKELGKDKLTSQDELKKFVEAYTSSFIHRLTSVFVGKVNRAVERFNEEELKKEMEDATYDWKVNLPAQVRDEESVRSTNALTKTLFVAYGVRKMKSVANPDACPICKKLDGKIVSIEGNFIDKNNDFEDGEGNVVSFKKSYSHPPYHAGCICNIAPAN